MAIFNYKKDVIKYKTFFSDDEMKNDYQKKSHLI